jgi:hypothetical protein
MVLLQIVRTLPAEAAEEEMMMTMLVVAEEEMMMADMAMMRKFGKNNT